MPCSRGSTNRVKQSFRGVTGAGVLGGGERKESWASGIGQNSELEYGSL